MAKTYSNISEREIIDEVLAGDVDRFEMLVQIHKPLVFSIAGKRVPRKDLDETAHEIFIRAYKSLSRFGGRSPFSHWLSRIAVRTCCDYWRKRYASRETPMSGLSEKHRDWLGSALTYESEYSFEDAEARESARELLLAALRELDPRDRAVVELVHLEERAVAEAADLLGWSKTNVKVRAFRARKKLRRIIENMANESKERENGPL